MNNNQVSLLYIGIQSILKSWTALQLAVSHGFGGAHSNEKAQWFVGAIEQYFNENEGLESYELEDMISEIMSSEFDTLNEDGSTAQVANEIWNIHKLWKQGNHNAIKEKLSTLPCVNLGECVASMSDEMHDDKEEEQVLEDVTLDSMNVSQPESQPQEPIVDEDGFTMVQTRSKRKSKR